MINELLVPEIITRLNDEQFTRLLFQYVQNPVLSSNAVSAEHISSKIGSVIVIHFRTISQPSSFSTNTNKMVLIFENNSEDRDALTFILDGISRYERC